MHNTGNPFTHPPTLPRPKGHLHSRSLSRSPARQHAFDPLLRDLSPTTTLRAFVTDPDDMSYQESDVLARSIKTSSISERALGAKAAQACLDLRAWTRELENWEWSGSFDLPEPARKKIRGAHNGDLFNANADGDEEVEYWGSLPAMTVQVYEARADEIGHGLDQIDVEELKDYVLNSHYRIESRPVSRDGSISGNNTSTDMKKLDDYTAVVTATILHALPYLTKLNRLLDTWTIRLIILRSAPHYLRGLNQARTDLDQCWAAIAVSRSSHSDVDPATFNRQTMHEMKSKLEEQVNKLGRRLDRFLDNLEGRDDSLPDNWIDDFEMLESAYGTWVVQAERKALENEWRTSIERTELEAQPSRANGDSRNGGTVRHISELEDPTLDHDAVRRLSMLSADPAGRLSNSREVPASADQEPRATHATKSGKNGADATPDITSRPIPVLSINDTPQDGGGEPAPSAPERVPSSGSLSKEDGMGQVAKRRAQFLNGIERNESLKMSKSPVRSFEHASNAFTRLFKKDRSPEQVKPKRSASSKWGSGAKAHERSVSAERNPLSPVSVASSKLNTASMASSVHSAASSSKTSRVASPEVETVPKKIEAPAAEDQDENGESHDEPPYHTPDHYREINEILRDSYQPSDLSSPFHSPERSPEKEDHPKDWPLVSPADTPQEDNMADEQNGFPITSSRARADSGPEVNTPDAALQTDVFDRMFVQSFPQAPEERPGSARASPSTAPSPGSHRRPASLPRNVRKQFPELPKYAGSYLDMVSVNNRRLVSSSTSRPTSRGNTRPSSKHHSSSSTRGTEAASFAPSISDASNSLKLKIPETKTAETDSNADEAFEERPHVAKRASTTSIEAFPRSQLKTIEVPRMPRRSSTSPGITPPQTPPRSRAPSTSGSRSGADPADGGPMAYKDMVSFPTPPPVSVSSRSTPPPTFTGKDTTTVLHTLPDSSLARSEPYGSPVQDENVSPSAPLNAAMAKRRGKSALRIENSPETSMPSSPRAAHPRTVEEDSFDRHVSEVLETLPGQIRFKSRPGAETPSLRPGDARGYNGPRAKNTPRRASKSGGAMTIVPAEASPKKTTSSHEPEVKLYHLTTAGRDDPIKLFVRLVGEGERVMVRVGGGWADLADYLRQYAEHHGSRTVSEGNVVEVQTVTSGPVTRKVSGPAEFNRAKSPIPSTNGTPRPSSKDSENEWSFQVMSNGRSTPSTTGRQTPTLASTPKSSSGSSRPSTATASRPPSRQNAGEVGLAGPSSTKKSALPEQKAKWVEGMIERAKQASAEKSNKEEKQKYFGELGKAGGTRRVIFRSSSGTGERPK